VYLGKNGAMSPTNELHKLVMVTSDDRVAELIEEVANHDPNHFKYPAFDLVVIPLATGSKEYITWVKTQTLKKDGGTAFFNEQINDPCCETTYNYTNPSPVESSNLMQLPGPPKSMKL